MNIGLDKPMLWLEEKKFALQKRKVYFLMMLCMAAGVSCLILGWMSYVQVIAATWIVIIMIATNQITMSCYDSTVKYLIAVKGSVRPLVSSKLYYHSVRIEAFIVLYFFIIGIVMVIRQQNNILFFIRSILCVIGTPVTLLFLVMTSLKIRKGWRSFVNIIFAIIFNVLFVAEQMFVNIYFAEIFFLIILFLTGMDLFRKLTGEALLSKGAGT